MIPSGLPNWFVIHIVGLNNPDLPNTTSKSCRSQQFLQRPVYYTHYEESGQRGKAGWFTHFPQQLPLCFSIKADFSVDAISPGCHSCYSFKKISVQTHYSATKRSSRTPAEHKLCLSKPSTWSRVTHSPGDSAAVFKLAISEALAALTDG